jgi:hypothetical protein
MKTALKISVLLNVMLCGCLIFTWFNQRREAAVMFPATTKDGPPPPAPAPAVPMSASAGEIPFRWSQLDATDYHIYVKNLRAIGCPEPTVRAIVTADVDSVYQIFVHQLEDKLSAMENGSWSQQMSADSSEATLKNALQRIPDEEAAKIADLLGLKPVTMPMPAAISPPAVVATTLPLVMQDVDLSALNLTADQQQAITGLKRDFLQQTGGTNQDENDLAYSARWQKAQRVANDMLLGFLGNQAYSQYQLMAYQKSLENN